MAQTNFATLLDDQKKVWTRDVWKQARERMVMSRFMGTSHNSMIHRVTELTRQSRGMEAIVHLVPDHEYDGIIGDNTLTGNEVPLNAYQDKLTIDMIRQAHTNTGKLNDQTTVINFREQARDQLSYWLADRMDQLFFLTLAGIDYVKRIDGGARKTQGTQGTTNTLGDLAFNYKLAPTSERHFMCGPNGGIVASDTSAIDATCTLSYAHIVRLNALAKMSYMRGIKQKDGDEVFHMFVHPLAMSELKLDPDFINNCRHAGQRGSGNSLFAGANTFVVDGLTITETRYIPNTLGLASGSKWGATGVVDGCMALLCGAQAIGFIDLDAPSWDERSHFDYGNYYGISYGKTFGMKKMQFKDNKGSKDRAVKQDYGVIRLDMAITQGI